MEFEWDQSKEAANVRQHGVDFRVAIEAFEDPYGIQLIDEKHSVVEPRLYWIGKTRSGRIVTVRFTKRGSKIRIYGCAEWRKFRSLYEAAKVK